MSRFRRFLQENGSYVTATSLLEYPAGVMRNYLLSRKFGVHKIRMGPRARLRGLSRIRMGEDFAAGESLWLEAITRYNDQEFSPAIVIGQHVRISHFVHITATHHVEIGDDVLMGSKVMITDHNHGQYSREHTSPHVAPTLRPLDVDRSVFIGPKVWLSDGVVVTAGASIGEGSIIGANSVVQGNIPAFCIASGLPATVRKRFNQTTKQWCNVE